MRIRANTPLISKLVSPGADFDIRQLQDADDSFVKPPMASETGFKSSLTSTEVQTQVRPILHKNFRHTSISFYAFGEFEEKKPQNLHVFRITCNGKRSIELFDGKWAGVEWVLRGRLGRKKGRHPPPNPTPYTSCRPGNSMIYPCPPIAWNSFLFLETDPIV